MTAGVRAKVNKISAILLVIVIILQAFSSVSYAAPTDEVIFVDQTIHNEVARQLGKDPIDSPIYELDIQTSGISVISLVTKDIATLEGLQAFKNCSLTQLAFNANQIADLSPISEITSLQTLAIGANRIEDISAISGLVNLQTINLKNNQITDISALSGMTKLTGLQLQNNKIEDISSIQELPLLSTPQLTSQVCNTITKSAKQNSILEVDLPPIFGQAKASGSKIYTENDFKVTGEEGIVSTDGSKITLPTNTLGAKSVTVEIVGGNAALTTVTINYNVVKYLGTEVIIEGKFYANDQEISELTKYENEEVIKIIPETTIKLSNLESQKEYLGILKSGEELKFRNIPYGEYEISCINPLDMSLLDIGAENNKIKLTVSEPSSSVEIKNEYILKNGFYSVTEKDNIFCVDVIPPEITLLGDSTITLYANEEYTEYGATASDDHDGEITNKIQITSNVDMSRIGTYKVVYKVADWYGNTAEVTRTVKVLSQVFDYTGDYQTFVAPANGIYKVELWGASGTVSTQLAAPGKGGYVSGNIYLEKGNEIYVYVGESSNDSSKAGSLTFNGGGAGYDNVSTAGRGGGATDIRLIKGTWNDETGLNSRIMVAGRRRSRASNWRWRIWRRCRRTRKL